MFFKLLAHALAIPAVTEYLIRRAMRTPYFAIVEPESGEIYMQRYWLFNPHPRAGEAEDKRNWLMRRLPSIRIHHILKPDRDCHLHDHPWNARTFILRGSYLEERLRDEDLYDHTSFLTCLHPDELDARRFFLRSAGQTAGIRHGAFHRIHKVSPDGVWTLFVTGRYRGPWGFLVLAGKIHWRDYLSHFRNNLKSEAKKE